MPTLTERVRLFAERHHLWSPSTRVLAAVSGGSDSVALLLLLRDLATEGRLVLAGMAHLHHHIRGEAADGDADFCRALADRLGIPIVVGDADVPAQAATRRQSIEVAARLARHAFLEQARASLGADRIALAHTLGDQAETVLMRLVRGAGGTGLSGMASQRGAIVRPLLTTRRDDLQRYLRQRGEAWREDESNGDRAQPRTRMRHDVLPLLQRHFNPRADVAIARAADILRADEALLAQLAAEAAATVVTRVDARVAINAAALAVLPTALARRVARIALETANPQRSYGLEEADALADTAGGRPTSNLSGVLCSRVGTTLVITRVEPDPSRGSCEADDSGFDVVMTVPGAVADPAGGWTVAAEGPVPAPPLLVTDAHRVIVDAAAVPGPLRVRRRRPGDRLQPLGMTGHKKLQDILVDRKVPRAERDDVPVVTDASGRIVWLAGHVLAHPFRVTARTTAVVILTMRRSSARRPS